MPATRRAKRRFRVMSHGRGSRASRFLSTTWKRNEQKSCPRDQSETAPRTHACHDAAHLRVRGPRAHRAGGAHQPQRQLRHGRRGGASACQPSDSLGNDSARRVARRLASRRSPRARRAPRGARARDATRFEGVGAILSRTTATPARVPCRSARPPRTRGGPNGPPRVYFFPRLTRSHPSPPPPRPPPRRASPASARDRPAATVHSRSSRVASLSLLSLRSRRPCPR